MRGLVAIQIVAILLAPFTLPAANRVGDANNDHTQNMADAALVQSRLYGTVTAAAVSPLALATNDSTLDLGDLVYVAQIASGARTGVAPRPNLLTLTPPTTATYPSGMTPNPVVAFGVASNYPAATRVNGLDALGWDILEGAAVESTLANSAASVGASSATSELVPLNPAPPNDTVTARLQIPILTSSGAASQTASAQRAMTVTAPFCGDGIPQAGEICDDGLLAVPILRWTFDQKEELVGVAFSDTRAYLAYGDLGLVVLDLQTPEPTLVTIYPFSYQVGGVTVVGSRAYVSVYLTGLTVLDISNPIPILIGSIPISGTHREMVVSGNRGYLVTGAWGLTVLDLSTPVPTVIGNWNSPGSGYQVAIAGQRAYLADNNSGLQVLDITNPTPVPIASYGTDIEQVAVAGTRAYLANSQRDLWVVDIAPVTPVLVGTYSYTAPTYIHGLTVRGEWAYLALGNECRILSIIDDVPFLRMSIPNNGYDLDNIAIEDTRLYLLNSYQGLQVYSLFSEGEGACRYDCTGTQSCGDGDVSGDEMCDGGNTVGCDGCSADCRVLETGCGDGVLCGAELCDDGDTTACGSCNADCSATSPADTCGDGIVCGGEVCDHGIANGSCGSCTSDCSGPTNVCGDGTVQCGEACEPTPLPALIKIGEYRKTGPDGSRFETIRIVGDRAYAASHFYSLKVFDLTNPNPVLLGSYPGIDARDVAISGGRAYVVNWNNLQILDVSSGMPIFLGSYTLSSSNGIAISGTRAYVSGLYGTTRVLDISTIPPVPMGQISTGGYGGGRIALSGSRAYVADGSNGLQILDISTPSPSWLGEYVPPGITIDVKVLDNRAYLTLDSLGVWVVDLSVMPPVLIGSHLSQGWPRQSEPLANRLYVADGSKGVESYTLSSPILTPEEFLDYPLVESVAIYKDRILVGSQLGIDVFQIYPSGEGVCLLDCAGLQTCGNGTIEGIEFCDDGNPTDCGTCNADCSGPSPVACGNGIVECSEVCDDGETTDCGICNADCSAFRSPDFCGNGVTCGAEVCDDGDTDDCTPACNATCTAPWVVACGNGIIECAEVCDDGFVSACGACNINCTGPGSGGVCGDGLACDNEACDDGNTANCDGCSGDCQTVEADCPGSQCDGTAAAPTCWLDSQCAPPACFDAPGDCYVSKCMGYQAQPEQIVISNAAMTGTLNGWTHNSATGSSQANNSGGAATGDYSPNSAAVYSVGFATQTPVAAFAIHIAASRINAGGGPARDVTLSVSLDGTPLGVWLLNTDNSWSWRYFGNRSLAAGAHALEFSCSNTSGRSRCAVDGVFITNVSANNPNTFAGMTPYTTANWDGPALDLYTPAILGHCDDSRPAPAVCGDGIACWPEACDDGATGWICPGGFSVGDCIDCQYRAQCADGDDWWGAGDGCSPMGRIEPYGCVAGLGCMDNIGGFIPCPGDAQCFFDTAWQCVVDAGAGCCYGGTSDDCSPGNICDNFSACDGQECFSWQWGGSCLGGFPPCSFGQTCIESWPTYSCVP